MSNQPQYNMIWRVIKSEVVPLSEREGLGQLVWSPLSGGVLTGKYQPGKELLNGSRAVDPKSGESLSDKVSDQALLERVQGLEPLAAEAVLSMAQLALAWVLQNRNVSTVLIGASRPEQVEKNVQAAGSSSTPSSWPASTRCWMTASSATRP